MIRLNSKEVSYQEGESLYDFLRRNSFDPALVAVEVDQVLVKRVDFKKFILSDKSYVEVFSFVGGG